jgi:HTH-type transcriptional regulator/antitoxin HigA
MNTFAEVFSPGEFLKEEMEARGWSQVELAEILGRPVKLVNEVLAGKKSITPETAVQLGDALGTGPEFWLNLESQYQLSKVISTSNSVARRAALYEKFPVREMIKRGWIRANDNIDYLEQEFRQYFGIKTLEQNPSFAHAAKKANVLSGATIPQMAWLLRAKQLAKEQVTRKYSKDNLLNALESLSALRSAPEEVRHASEVLNKCGVRLVFVEALPSSKIDGACFWLESNQPVIAMSLRLDRIDNFWFVLRHEIEHVLREHGLEDRFILDVDIEGIDSTDEQEILANEAAANFCVSQSALADFIARVSPYFSEERVVLFAKRLEVHPGLVAGQLRRKLNRWDRWSNHLEKVRHIAINSAPVDGWGLIEAKEGAS